MRLVLLTAAALAAFAANSLLCRMALGGGGIDAAAFTAIRLAAGAALLAALARSLRGGSAAGAAWLFIYAAAFSFAYRDLTVGTGALLLFGSVQLTMLLAAVRGGERPPPLEWVGIGLALAGLVYLVIPGLAAPAPDAAALMVAAGVAWGFYSLRGRGSRNALADTAGNFARSVPAAAVVWILAAMTATPEPTASGLRWSGVVLAVASGALTSGVGYVLWYAALPGLSATRAALVQTLVPILAAFGGAIFLGESITLRLVLASLLTLGGIGLAVVARGPGGGPSRPGLPPMTPAPRGTSSAR